MDNSSSKCASKHNKKLIAEKSIFDLLTMYYAYFFPQITIWLSCLYSRSNKLLQRMYLIYTIMLVYIVFRYCWKPVPLFPYILILDYIIFSTFDIQIYIRSILILKKVKWTGSKRIGTLITWPRILMIFE